MDICNLWFDSICFGIGKGIASLIKGMIKGAMMATNIPKNIQIIFLKKNKDVKISEKNVHVRKMLKIERWSFTYSPGNDHLILLS